MVSPTVIRCVQSAGTGGGGGGGGEGGGGEAMLSLPLTSSIASQAFAPYASLYLVSPGGKCRQGEEEEDEQASPLGRMWLWFSAQVWRGGRERKEG